MEPVRVNQIELVGSATPKGGTFTSASMSIELPNKAGLHEDVAEFFHKIHALQARIVEIDSLTDELQQNEQASSAEILNVQSRLRKFSSSILSVKDEKKVLREKFMGEKKALQEHLSHADKLSTDPTSYGNKVPYLRVEQIDVDIKKLRYLLTHASLSLEDKNKLEQEVNFLKSLRDLLKNHNDGLKQILRDIADVDAIMNDLLKKQEEQSKLLAQIEEKNFYQQLEFQTRVMERNAANRKIKALKEQAEKHCELEGQKKEKEILQSHEHEEKKEGHLFTSGGDEQENILNQKVLESVIESYRHEIILVDQLTCYLNRFAPLMEEAASLAPQEVVQEIVTPKDFGTVLVSKKKRFEEDSWFSGTRKNKNAKETVAPKSKRKEKFPLSLDALISFEKVKISPPATVRDVAKTIHDLKLRREEFLKLQVEVMSRIGEQELEPKAESAKVGRSPTSEVASVNI